MGFTGHIYNCTHEYSENGNCKDDFCPIKTTIKESTIDKGSLLCNDNVKMSGDSDNVRLMNKLYWG